MTARVDRRVLILAQLFDILKGLTITLTGTDAQGHTGGQNSTPAFVAAGNIVHNRNELPKEKVPGIILLDGDEAKDKRFPDMAGRGQRPGPGMMLMTPEIYVVLDVRKPNNINVGEDLNAARQQIIDLVLHDAGLQAITGSNGSITYDGAITDLARNREMKGQMGLSFTFSYPFVPDEIATAR